MVGVGLAAWRVVMHRVGLLGIVLLAACSYRPGAFAYGMKTFPGTGVTVGCLDIAIDRRADYDGSAVLEYRFGNRCERAQVVDLASVRVIGRDLDGNEHVLSPFDPGGQIRALPLDAGLAGGEALSYPSEHKLVQVCVDAASIVRQQPERWLCFARTEDPKPPPPDDLRPPSEQSEPNRTLVEDDAREEVP